MDKPPEQAGFSGRGLFTWVFLILVVFQVLKLFNGPGPKVISVSELEDSISAGKVDNLIFVSESTKVFGTLKPDTKGSAPVNFETTALSVSHADELRKAAKEKGIKPEVKSPPSPWTMSILTNLMWIVPFFLISFVIGRKQMEQMNGKGGPFSFGKSKAKRFSSMANSKKRTTFDDVAGCEEAKEEVQEIVEFLKNPGKFTRLGGKVPKGILLYGAPGTGKTLLARAVAGEAGVEFLSASGSEFVEMFVGVGATRVRDLFESARKLSPCVVFIDEIDAVGKKRGVAIGGGHDEREQTLDALLTELDGFDKNGQIVVFAATNRPDVLDEALIRPGRFDRSVQVPKPNVEGREMILKIHTKGVPLGPDVNLSDIAKDTFGMVGADLANVVNEAVLIATRANKDQVGQSDFSEAVDKVSMGPMRRSVKLNDKEKRMTAYHESGHTLVAMLTNGADPVHKVTIVPRGQALGFTKPLPDGDRYSFTKDQLDAKVAVLLGGRAAEETVFNEITTGASDDLDKATNVLRKMVYELGMDEGAGMIVHKAKTDFWGNSTGLDASEKTKELLEAIVKEKSEKIYKDVKKLLSDNRSKLDALANALLEKETLTAAEIRTIINST